LIAALFDLGGGASSDAVGGERREIDALRGLLTERENEGLHGSKSFR
jgi:hypothetical protein